MSGVYYTSTKTPLHAGMQILIVVDKLKKSRSGKKPAKKRKKPKTNGTKQLKKTQLSFEGVVVLANQQAVNAQAFTNEQRCQV